MDIKKISDRDLWDLTKGKVQIERNLTLEIIELLREVRSRRLHLEKGYSSFHQYCVKEFKYDDGSAHRRIKALDLVSQVPEVTQSLQEGTLSLTTASQVQNFFEKEAKKDRGFSKEDKLDLLSDLESKSKREIEKTLATLAPETLTQTEKLKYVSGTHLKLELVIDEPLLKKMERLKDLTSHKNRTLRDLIESLVDDALKKRDPEIKAMRASPGKLETPAQHDAQAKIKVHAGAPAKTKDPAKTKVPAQIEGLARTKDLTKSNVPSKTEVPAKTKDLAMTKAPAKIEVFENIKGPSEAKVPAQIKGLARTKVFTKIKVPGKIIASAKTNGSTSSKGLLHSQSNERSRYVPAEIKHQVWIKAGARCTYTSPSSGERCEAKRYLQIEHVQPFALGGPTSLENLTLLCSGHNKLRAIQAFGTSIMDPYSAGP